MEDKNPDYFEGILQLRNPSKAVSAFVDDYIRKSRIGLAKRKKVKNGFDYYLASNAFILKIGKVLQQRFGGEMKRSSKLHHVDRQTSKKKYRGTVLFRLPDFKKGDSVEHKGESCIVESMGKNVLLRSTVSGKKYRVKYDQI